MKLVRSRTRRGPLSIAVAASILFVAFSARAGDPATAQALFDQARELMTQKRWSEACPKLEESQRLDPGGGTLLHLAICREHEGKIATAWALYQEALGAANRDKRKDRAKIAQARIDVLKTKLPRLRLRVAPQNKRIPGFFLSRDDIEVGEPQWGESIPVDPGKRSIVARADGYKTWTKEVVIPDGPSDTVVEVPELERAEPPADRRERRPTSPWNATPPSDGDGRGETQRTIGLLGASLGVGGVVTGSVFGLLAFSKHAEADRECQPPDHRLCSGAGVAAGEDSRTFGNISTIAFIAGGALLAGGAALYFTAPKPSTKTRTAVAPYLGLSAAGLGVGGSF